MPEYRGASLRDVPIQSDLFKGYKFSQWLSHLLHSTHHLTLPLPVVSSDPKSRTGAEDKVALLQM